MSQLTASEVVYLERCGQLAHASVHWKITPRKHINSFTCSRKCSVTNWTIGGGGVYDFSFFFKAGECSRRRRGLTVLTSVNRGSRWKGSRGFASGEAWVLPGVGRASCGTTLWHVLPRRQHGGEETCRWINIWRNDSVGMRWFLLEINIWWWRENLIKPLSSETCQIVWLK